MYVKNKLQRKIHKLTKTTKLRTTKDINIPNNIFANLLYYADYKHKLMDYTDRHGDVSDPWYTRDFNVAYQDIYDGCKALLEQVKNLNN